MSVLAKNTMSHALSPTALSRRAVVFGLPLVAAACVSRPQEPVGPYVDPYYAAMYGPVPDEPYPLPPIDITRVNPVFYRQVVDFQTMEQPGTLVVDPANKFLYLVQEGGKAMRYGVGVGKEGLAWSGRAIIQRKATWPRWTPTQDMIARDARNAEWAGGMEPGLQNPLGARAMYLYRDGKDTLYRIHGTREPYSIGTAVSSGCIRLMNQDIIDLYSRVPTGSPVVVLGANGMV
jgi:lipoprotein-anchoring transpeptidase ErfK/SrfK